MVLRICSGQSMHWGFKLRLGNPRTGKLSPLYTPTFIYSALDLCQHGFDKCCCFLSYVCKSFISSGSASCFLVVSSLRLICSFGSICFNEYLYQYSVLFHCLLQLSVALPCRQTWRSSVPNAWSFQFIGLLVISDTELLEYSGFILMSSFP